MTTVVKQEALEQELTRDELLAIKNKRTAVTVFQISWIMVFVCLSIVNLQIRSNFPTWPPPGVAALDRVLPTLATIGLIISALAARAGLQAIRLDEVGRFLSRWRIALALGAAFVLLMIYEWLAVEVDPQYGTLFRVMVAYHGIHALVIGYIMLRVYRTGSAGGYDSVRHWPVEGAAKLWYFVVVAWLLFYVVLYIL
ncbi:MAG: cytochrome c oxidase subunit 3 [Aggregatilineales bacterium]